MNDLNREGNNSFGPGQLVAGVIGAVVFTAIGAFLAWFLLVRDKRLPSDAVLEMVHEDTVTDERQDQSPNEDEQLLASANEMNGNTEWPWDRHESLHDFCVNVDSEESSL
jgi:hypothetical protein